MTRATVYVDHPVHAFATHTLNIDFAAPERGPAARVAVELHPDSAFELLTTVAAALLSAPSDITGVSDAERSRLVQLVDGQPSADEGSLEPSAARPA